MAKPWFGLDTERDSKTGEFVCGWAVGEGTFRFTGLEDLEAGTYWVWNLAYDLEGMLRDLKVEEAWAAKADGALFTLDGGDCVYYHGKRFNWRKGNKKIVMLEASSFYGRQPLSAIGAKEGGVDASKMSLWRYGRDAEYRALVDKYCQQDAWIVYDRIIGLAEGLDKLGVNIGSTPGATARGFFNRLGAFPRVIWETHKPFLRSYCGGRFEITKRGVLHQVKQYDLVSAYPWALAQCPWLTESAFSRITRRVNDNALYGTYQVRFKHDDYLGVAPRWRNGVRVYSKAQDSTWLTRPEVDYLRRVGADYTVIKGVEIFDEGATGLWRDVVTELFAMKQRTKKEADKGWGAKIILNSQYGILIMLVRKAGKWVPIQVAENPVDFAGTLALEEPPKAFEGGKFYAPVYAGNLTALVRVRMLEAGNAVGADAYIGGHTDSVLTTGTLPGKMLGNGLGDWALEKEASRADVCKTGMYALGDSVKMRGITRSGTASLLWDETHQRKTRIGIKSAKSWDEVSVIVPKVVRHNYAIENKRKWNGELTRGLIALERHIDSEPLENVV